MPTARQARAESGQGGQLEAGLDPVAGGVVADRQARHVRTVAELLLKPATDRRSRPTDLEAAAWHRAPCQGGPEPRLAALGAILKG